MKPSSSSAALAPVAAALTLLLAAAPAQAHNDVEFAVHGGYGVSGSVPVTIDATKGSVSIDAAPVYGALAGYRLEQDGFVYLSYSRQESTAWFTPKGALAASGGRGIALDSFQFGGYIETWRGPLAPFLGLSMGLARLSALGGAGNDVNFAAVLEAGAKYELLPSLHLRLTGRLPITFVKGENSSYCVTGTDCYASLGAEPLVQGQVLLGVGVGF